MSDVQINNKVFLSGKVITNPVFTHEVMGEGFYEVMLAVKRMSEQEDVIPVTLSERLMIDNEIRVGDTLSVDGQFRSYNKYENGKSRLMLTVFTREIADDDEERNPNIIELTGYVCKPTVYPHDSVQARNMRRAYRGQPRLQQIRLYPVHCVGQERALCRKFGSGR